MEHGHTSPSRLDLRALLNQDHERLDKLFAATLTAFHAGSREEAAALWSEFEIGVLNHFEFEESYVLPQFAKLHSDEAAALLAEHKQVRAALDRMSVGVDLHLTREDMVRELIQGLRAHAQREDRLMYRCLQAFDKPEHGHAYARAADALRAAFKIRGSA